MKQILEGCGKCVCTLICYWWPSDAQCQACLEEDQAAELFIDHDKCEQGWLLSNDGSCFKPFKEEKTWDEANISCHAEGGKLAEPTTEYSIFTVIEALNVHGIREESWIGGRKGDDEEEYHWNEDKSEVANWALDFPTESSTSSCMHQTAFDGYFRNKNCSEKNPFVCQKKEHSSYKILALSSSSSTITYTPTTTTTTTQPLATTECSCGLTQRGTRIVGGVETEINGYPFQVMKLILY